MSQPSSEPGAPHSENVTPAPHAAPGSTLFVGLPMHFLALVMLAGVALNMVNVVARYVFSAPIFWAEEVLVYAMIWAVFLALPAVTFQNAHLRMDLFYLSMPAWLKRSVDALGALLFVGFGGFATFHSIKVLQLLATNKQASVTAGLPMSVVHAALPVGFALMVLAIMTRLIMDVRRHREGHSG